MRTSLLLGLALILLLPNGALGESADVRQIDPYTLTGPRSFRDGYPALADDGAIHVVVEIPAGSNAKWEVRKEDGALAWEFKNGAPRVVKYLPYPGNYGMIPCTLLAKDEGGDGDPLDVLVLGQAVARGSVIRARPIGILRLLDGGEIDDKVLAVAADAPFEPAKSATIEDLRENYPGVLDIVEIWFTYYKGPGEMESLGYANAGAAWEMIYAAMLTFDEAAAAGAASAQH